MPIGILASVLTKYLPLQYALHATLLVVAVTVLRAFSQGRVTDRERDLHGRTILLTGGFTPLGSTLMEALAKRGAHIIALCNESVDSEHISLVVQAMRETTKNDNIYAEECNLLSSHSVRSFCTKFITAEETRLDAIILAHEYEHMGPIFASASERQACDERRAAYSSASFLIVTLLLPVLLVAPPERDIRIISVINPFYAAATPFFPKAPRGTSQFLREGFRGLKTAIVTRHLQRVFDALPSAPAPNPEVASEAVASNKMQKSNIVAVSVSPGFNRSDTIARILRADSTSLGFRLSGLLVYILLLPILFLFTKSSNYAIQSILHVLFLPTPFKRVDLMSQAGKEFVEKDVTEILRPGALYSDCSVVRPRLNKRNWEAEIKETSSNGKLEQHRDVEDKEELGGEELGRIVWESCEQSLKQWEAETGGGAADDKESEREIPKNK